MRPRTSLRDALSDPHLMGHVLKGDSWLPWRTILIASMGEALTDEERVVFKQLTGREREPLQRVNELEVVAGRRGGKTTAMAAGATYIAACCDHSDALARAEQGVLLCVAQDQRVAKQILDRVEANLQDSPILHQLIKGRTQDSIELTNNISIEVRPSIFPKTEGTDLHRNNCGRACVLVHGVKLRESRCGGAGRCSPRPAHHARPLHHGIESPTQRSECFGRRSNDTTVPMALLACSSPRAPQETSTHTIPQSEIDRELERDRARNTAELLAEFRNDLEGYVTYEVVEACIGSYFEMPPARSVSYYAFTDPVGWSAMILSRYAICHREHDRVVIDCIREVRPPFSPEQVMH